MSSTARNTHVCINVISICNGLTAPGNISLAFRERTCLCIPWLPLPVPVSCPVHYRVNNSLISPNHIRVDRRHVHSSMTVLFTANNTTLISVSLTDRVGELCCLKLYTFDNATLHCEMKVIRDDLSTAKFVTFTIVYTRRLGQIV
jgi:hypothetical protein